MSGNLGQCLRRGTIAGLLIVGFTVAPAFGDEDPGATHPGVPPTVAPEPSPEPPPTPDPPVQTAPSDPAAVPTVHAVPEQALIDPATGFQIERSSGYLIHPGTGYLIEPGTGNLVDGRTWLYTELKWNPSTGEVTSVFDASDEAPAADPSSTSPPTSNAEPTTQTSRAPAPSASEADLSATKASAEHGTDWSTHWLTRTLVILLLVGAGALYYAKLRGQGPNPANSQ